MHFGSQILFRHRVAYGLCWGSCTEAVTCVHLIDLQELTHTEGSFLELLDSRSKRVPVVCLTYHDVCRCLELTENDPKFHLFAFGTGYLNVLGQAANLGCGAYLTADCIDFMVEATNGHEYTPLETLLTYASESAQSLVHGWSHPNPPRFLP